MRMFFSHTEIRIKIKCVYPDQGKYTRDGENMDREEKY